MIDKLPKWVEIGAFLLALGAGAINAIALLGFNHQGVSHLTGSSSLLGVELVSGNYREVAHLGGIMLSFVLGAGVSGFVIANESLKLGRRYGFTLLAVALLLLLSMCFLKRGSNLGHYLASAACGLQNAMTSAFSGALVRTTHVTGLFTDLGIIVGLWLRGHKADKRRVLLYLTLITGFIAGGVLGAISFTHYGFDAILIPALLSAAMAWVYMLLRKKAVAVSAGRQ